MGSYKRVIELTRESVNVDQGTFRAVLFSDGEAADGHILRADGGSFPEDGVPLFLNHQADPRTQLGRVYHDSTRGGKVFVRGEILKEGDGMEADVRRDILLKMSRGLLNNLSGRWDSDPGSAKPRRSLPKEHPAHATEGRAGSGLYFDQWTAMEGSIVGLGADPQATVRWAEEAQHVSTFWRGLSPEEQAAEEPEVVVEAATEPVQEFRALIQEAIEPLLARIECLEEDFVSDDPSEETGESRSGIEDPAPEESPAESRAAQWTPQDVARMIAQALESERSDFRAELSRTLDAARGRI